MKALRGAVKMIKIPERHSSYTPDFRGGKYAVRNISPENYREIKEGTVLDALYVDGGNGSIITGASFDVSLFRFASTFFRGADGGAKMSRSDVHSAIVITQRDGEEYTFTVYDSDLPEEVVRMAEGARADIYDENAREKNEFSEIGPEIASSTFREAMELNYAEYMLNRMERGSAVVLDGTLRRWSNFVNEEMANMDSAARSRGIILAGVSKTTRIRTKQGPSITAAAMDISRAVSYPIWRVNVGEIQSETHSARIFVAKLHPISAYAYRVEMNYTTDGEEETNNLFYTMSRNVGGLHRYGYPYGLLAADERARVHKKEVRTLKPLLMSGADRETAERIELDVKSVDMHQNLDRIIYGGE